MVRMSVLESLFSGAKAFVKVVTPVVQQVVKSVLEEIDRSAVGKVITEAVKVATEHIRRSAVSLAEEEVEIHARAQRDGRLRDRDRERLEEINTERGKYRATLEREHAEKAAKELYDASDDLVVAPVTSDEVSANTGLMATKACPCGGVMTIRQGPLQVRDNTRKFYWQCTASKRIPCPRIYFDPTREGGNVLRQPDADLDGDARTRNRLWNEPGQIAVTHARVRQGLGDVDDSVLCPHHLLPMKQVERSGANRTLFGSYEYVCMGVDQDGMACTHRVPIETFPQVASMLRRREGKGILDT